MRTIILASSLLFLVLGRNAVATEKNLIIQCKSNNPDLEIFRPIYNIDFVKKIAKVGAADYIVLDVKSEKIVLGKFNPVVETKIEFDRVTGKYTEDQKFFASDKNPEKKIRDTGKCIKIEKAF